ncbi:MAG: hypothetical protein ACOYBQ_10310 [Fluviibacter sp.]
MASNRDSGALLALAAIAAIAFWPRDASASVAPDNEGALPDPMPNWPDPSIDQLPDWTDPPIGDLYPIPDLNGDMNAKLDAFLMAIRYSEHKAIDVQTDWDFNTFYGGALFSDMSDHPVLTGEFAGVKLPDKMCRDAGFKSGCVSTAAGAFQMTVPTWKDFRKSGAWGPRLNDFTPASQMEAARRIIAYEGAMPLIEAGDIVGAIYKVSKRWASLPKSQAKQPQRTIGQVLAYYSDALSGMA